MGKDKSKEKKMYDISEIMEKFGKYQYWQFILCCLPPMCITMISINFVFTVGDLDYRCRVDECDDANSTAQLPTWWPNTTIDRCSAPVLKSGEDVCTNNSFTGELRTCNNWIYESNKTVIAKLNLACQPWRSNLIGTIHNFGMLLSMVISGWMSDKFGRKPALIFCVVGGTIGHLKTVAPSYLIYVIIEFLEAAVTGGSYAACMVIMLEIVGKKYRLMSGVIFAYAIYIGESIFAVIAMFVPYWKHLIHIINGPCIFFLIYIFILNESPRWLIVTGKVEKAKKALKKIANYNKMLINEKELAELNVNTLKEKFSIGRHEIKENFKHIFTSKDMLKWMLVGSWIRFTSCFVYYGLMINSVWLPGDKYTNFLLSTVMSFPGELICLYLMNKVGRKKPMMSGFFLCGVFSVISAFTPARLLWLKLTLFLLGKVIISACYTGAITYTMEMFPTSVRGTMLGLCSLASRFGCMLAPLTPILNSVSEILPYALFSGAAIIATLLLNLTPETKNLPLFDTIKQVENYTSTGKIPGQDSDGCTENILKTVDSPETG